MPYNRWQDTSITLGQNIEEWPLVMNVVMNPRVVYSLMPNNLIEKTVPNTVHG
jgi:hypothetical protein